MAAHRRYLYTPMTTALTSPPSPPVLSGEKIFTSPLPIFKSVDYKAVDFAFWE